MPLLWLGGTLLVLWLVAWLAFELAGAVVHVLVLGALALIVWGLVNRARRAA
jgi:hypothetical protein